MNVEIVTNAEAEQLLADDRFRLEWEMGPFEFRRVADPLEFDELFDEMVELYDLRHGAVHGFLPFCSVDHQKEFHAALFREPGLLHATVMRAGGRLVAAPFGVCSKAEVHFGTIVHDPRLARHSPGKVGTGTGDVPPPSTRRRVGRRPPRNADLRSRICHGK